MADTNTSPSQAELEKAASVRLFEKVAAANNIDLNDLDDEKLAELYVNFETNVLPGIMERHAYEKQAAAIKEAMDSLTEEQVYELFEKQAAAEPDLVAAGGLDALSDAQLKLGFAHFVDNLLPIMAGQDWEPIGPAQSMKIAAAQEQATKIAEAELLGRHMARGWWDEHDKIAAAREEAAKEDEKKGTEKDATVVPGTGAASKVPTAVLKGVNMAERGAGNVAARLRGLSPGAKAGLAGGAVGGAVAGGAAMKAHQDKQGSVTLSADDVAILNKLAAAGDLAGFQKAAEAISKAAELPPQVVKKNGDEKKDDKGDEKDEKDEKTASAALDLLVEARATEMASGWLRENGYLKDHA